MKSVIKVNYCLIVLLLLICFKTKAQKQSVKAMLKNPRQQKEIFHAISEDTVQMRQFLKHSMQNKAAAIMINKHQMLPNKNSKIDSIAYFFMHGE